jgi:hypothetical protein
MDDHRFFEAGIPYYRPKLWWGQSTKWIDRWHDMRIKVILWLRG